MPLITRNHPKLTLEGARAVLAAAERHALEIKISMNIAVVDDGGNLLAFARMDGAKPASIAVSLVKARAAAMRRAPTGAPMSGDHVNVALALGLASAAQDHQTPIRGGFPLVVDGEVVGAIGVSAGTEDQDVDVARAGVAAFEQAKP
ncbi:MAG TPA: heme-binding protein [Candidatus Baltobacteraceae bacterium]|nr:heme-binding protein [Candidatus Baltobacteraceae bacterium]